MQERTKKLKNVDIPLGSAKKKQKKQAILRNLCDFKINKGASHHLATIPEEDLFEKIKALDSEFKKTEYNCQRKHHHNPGTNIQITALKRAEVDRLKDD